MPDAIPVDPQQQQPPASPKRLPLNHPPSRGPASSMNSLLDDGGGSTVLFDTTSPSDIKLLKEQVMSNSPFGEALKAQEELKDTTATTLRAHYINKKKEGEITREHEQYNLTYAMMLGIRHSVQSWEDSNTSNKKDLLSSTVSRHKTLETVSVKEMKKGVTKQHFSHTHKTYFPPEGGNMHSPSALDHTPPHLLKGGFKFKDYAPEVFARLRKRFEIDDQDYLHSLCGSFNFLEFISNSKSGEFFFYSHDGRFMIKTQKRSESKFMLNMLPDYYAYVADNPNSLLVRVCGVHRVKMPQLRRKMHFVIMMSVFSEATEARPVNRIYDLKGAIVGRKAGQEENVKKDLDIVEDETKIHLGRKRQEFLDQVGRDSAFLASQGVMDYSLLVGIHGGAQQQQHLMKRHLSQSQMGSFVFRSQRKSTLGMMMQGNGNGGSSSNFLLLDGSASLDTVPGVNANPGGLVPSLPTTFSKHQVVRQSFDLPHISEATPSTKHLAGSGPSGLTSLASKEKMAGEIAAMRMSAPDALASPASFRSSNAQQHQGLLNSFYKIDSPDLPGGANAGVTYHVGIIDIFTQYNIKKRGEHAFKTLSIKNSRGISAIAPQKYQKRFHKFISSLVVED